MLELEGRIGELEVEVEVVKEENGAHPFEYWPVRLRLKLSSHSTP